MLIHLLLLYLLSAFLTNMSFIRSKTGYFAHHSILRTWHSIFYAIDAQFICLDGINAEWGWSNGKARKGERRKAEFYFATLNLKLLGTLIEKREKGVSKNTNNYQFPKSDFFLAMALLMFRTQMCHLINSLLFLNPQFLCCDMIWPHFFTTQPGCFSCW